VINGNGFTGIRAGLIATTIVLSGCSATLEDYQDEGPTLALSEFFQGRLHAWGMVQDRSGKVIRRFRAEIRGEWHGQQGILDEQFWFNDGEQQQRCWRLQQQGNRYSGTAADVIGTARGEVSGNALNWRYQLEIPVEGRRWQISLDDWMYLIDENNLLNRARMSKLGINVGEITLYIRKVSDQPGQPFDKDCQL